MKVRDWKLSLSELLYLTNENQYWRRHKHLLEGDPEAPPQLPLAPPKRTRYSQSDDILLAKYFAQKPEGILDDLFRAFAKEVSRCRPFLA
jgi:hypothetical protein